MTDSTSKSKNKSERVKTANQIHAYVVKGWDMQNDVGLALDCLAQLSHDRYGRFDKDAFRVFALIHFAYLRKQGLSNDALRKEFGSHLRRILGHGHTFATCIQFAQGKKARAAVKKCQAIATECLADLPTDVSPKSVDWELRRLFSYLGPELA